MGEDNEHPTTLTINPNSDLVLTTNVTAIIVEGQIGLDWLYRQALRAIVSGRELRLDAPVAFRPTEQERRMYAAFAQRAAELKEREEMRRSLPWWRRLWWVGRTP